MHLWPQNIEQILNSPTIYIYIFRRLLQLSLYMNNRIVGLQLFKPFFISFIASNLIIVEKVGGVTIYTYFLR